MSELPEDEKKLEEVPQLVPLTNLYLKSNPIEQKFFNTPNRMAEVGWLPHWTIREAVRELLANMIDQARTVTRKFLFDAGELEFTEEPGRFAVHIGSTLLAEAKWGKKNHKYIKNYLNAGVIKSRAEAKDYIIEETQFLELISYSSALPYTSFYVGHSSKRNNLAVIGKHGEGLTGACVVLNRAGCNIIAECTHNAYKAHIVRLKNDVCFQLERKREGSGPPQDTVRFTVVFDPRQPAEDVQDLMNSVRLPATAADAGITTSRGTLLLEPALRGKQFNRSIFVAEDAHCLFGYDFLDPDKTLLEGRDRNAHGKSNLIKKRKKIISEAILQSDEVRKEVLKCFMYGPTYNPDTAGESVLTHYDDVKDGEGLTYEAVQALRQQYEQSLPVGQQVVYCSRDTTMLNEIKRVNGMVSAYCHRVLHNHAAIVLDFQSAIKLHATVLDPTTRVGALHDQLLPLLGVRELKQSVMELPGAQAGLWVLHQVGYVTCVRSLGAAHAVGLTEAQETSVIRSLRFAQIPVENEIKIMRLLRNQPDPEPETEAAAELETEPEVLPSVDEESTTKEEVKQEGGTVAADGDVTMTDVDATPEQQQDAPLLEAQQDESPVAHPAPVKDLHLAQEDNNVTMNEVDVDASNDASTSAAAAAAVTHFNDSDVILPIASTPVAAAAPARDPSISAAIAAGAHVEEIGANEAVEEALCYDDESIGEYDAFDLGSETCEDYNEEMKDRRAKNLPSPKRQRLDRSGSEKSGTSSADTSVEVIDLSSDSISVVTAIPHTIPELLQDLPLEMVLSDARHSTVRQVRFFKPCGVWLYSDKVDSEQKMEELLNVCLPTHIDRFKLRILKSLLHIVVFVTEDKRAPPAFNYGSHCVCINLGACGSEQMFKYILHAQMQAVNLVG